MECLEMIFAVILIFGIGLGIFLYGSWAGKQNSKPIGFWANGKPLDQSAVSDISGYNRAYGKLFRRFSVPCMISAFVTVFHAVAGMIILVLWAVLGILWLIRGYRKLEKQYISR